MSERKRSGMGKGRSRLLYQVTILLIVVLLIIGAAVFLVVNGTLNRLIEEDKKDRIDSEARIIYNDAVYISEIQIANMLTDFEDLDIADLILAVREKRINDFIRYANDGLKGSVESGMMGAEAILVADPSSRGALSYPYVLAASEDALTFMEVPSYLIEAFEDGQSYVFLEEGVPELGFEGEYLVTLIELKDPITGGTFAFIGIRPFGEEIARIDSFYSNERSRMTLILALVIGFGIILVFVITFFILRRMIYKQITKPIDELTGVAAEVMDGNLDVEIEVREGEEFETLKRAFREMIGSIRSMVNRSLGDD
ncbi:MAG: HAMP domain-containing protein [Actinomycetota bacterium]